MQPNAETGTGTHNGTPSSSSMNITSPAFETTVVSYAARMLKLKSPPTAAIDDSVAPYVTSILRSALSNLSDNNLNRQDQGQGGTDTGLGLSSGLLVDENGDGLGGIDIQTVIEEYDALMELLMEQCEMEANDAKETLKSIARAIKTGNCEMSMSFNDQTNHFVGTSHSKLNSTIASRKSSFNSLVGNGTLMMGYGDIGNKFRSKSMGAEHDYYAEDDALRLLGNMLQEDRGRESNTGTGTGTGRSNLNRRDSAGSISTLPSWSVVNTKDADSPGRGAGDVIEEEPSFFFEQDEPPTPDMKQAPLLSLQTPMKFDSSGDFLMKGFSPFLTEEEKKVAEGLKNLPAPTFSFTPLKQDQLIPLDLLGAIDDPTSPKGFLNIMKYDVIPDDDDNYNADADTNANDAFTPQKNRPKDTMTESDSPAVSKNEHQADHDHDPATPLRSTQTHILPLPILKATPQSKTVLNSKGKKKGKKNNDLAATLFTRPRSRSMHSYDDKSPKMKPMAPPSASQLGMAGLKNCSAEALMSNSIPALFRKQLDSAVEILMAMNYDVCREAAHEAALVSNADVNVAQHVIDGALTAPPVCRHLLNDGCYRSDCHFSHDVDGHTCLFWLRGRCGKGDAGCRFMHGFSEKLLDGVKVDDRNKFLLPPAKGLPASGPKSAGVRTGNLVQHNMKASFSVSQSCRVSFSSPTESASRNRSVSDVGTFFPRGDMKVSPLPSALASSLQSPSHMSMAKNKSMDALNKKVPKESKPASTFSFASIASKGYSKQSSFNKEKIASVEGNTSKEIIKTVRIPQDLKVSSHQRSAASFRSADPIARYKEVASSVSRNDVIDLNFQSVKTFPTVLSTILPEKLKDHGEVWIVTGAGSGHNVNKNSHLKGGGVGVFETAVTGWLISNEYSFSKGKDKHGSDGALLVYGGR